jgi:mercuric ion transport protein
MSDSIMHAPDRNPRLLYARFALYTGGISAILASTCCLGPFLLVTLGLSNAWILYLITVADWARPFFILLALITLGVSYQYIWGSFTVRKTDGIRMRQKELMPYKVYFLFVVFLVAAMLMLPYFAQNMGLLIE